MSALDQEQDGDLPVLCSSLSDWRWFIVHLLGIDSAAYAYVDRLCRQFGGEYEIEIDPNLFLDHIGRVAFTNDREGAA
jgi:hypothetical protein